jgi:hypothetical protein
VIPAVALADRDRAMLGDPKIDVQAQISVQVTRIHDPAATVMVYTLPDRYVKLSLAG